MQKMGGLSSLMGMLPGMSGAQMQQMKKAKLDDGVVKRQLAMLSSMTAGERKKPDLIKASRKQRIAAGSGTTVQEDRKSVVEGKSVSVRVDPGGRRIIKKKK